MLLAEVYANKEVLNMHSYEGKPGAHLVYNAPFLAGMRVNDTQWLSDTVNSYIELLNATYQPIWMVRYQNILAGGLFVEMFNKL